ncbi:MAG TPA: hypothetical protein VGO93_18745 [Candidatus Xenobia bacterium]|jgi:hypothetical protein
MINNIGAKQNATAAPARPALASSNEQQDTVELSASWGRPGWHGGWHGGWPRPMPIPMPVPYPYPYPGCPPYPTPYPYPGCPW